MNEINKAFEDKFQAKLRAEKNVVQWFDECIIKLNQQIEEVKRYKERFLESTTNVEENKTQPSEYLLWALNYLNAQHFDFNIASRALREL